VINAEGIDHSAPIPHAPEWGNPVAHGDYLVKISGCRTCHGPQLNGGKDPNPDAPHGPNITPGGAAAKWSTDQFIRTIRTGITPDERHLSPDFMPWREIGRYTNEELTAIHDYLRSLEPLADAKF
jgi:mono/diheme cytochrome c family protein